MGKANTDVVDELGDIENQMDVIVHQLQAIGKRQVISVVFERDGGQRANWRTLQEAEDAFDLRDKRYDYFYVGDVKVGDMAVVFARGEFKVVRVVGVKAKSPFANTFALGVFNSNDQLQKRMVLDAAGELREKMADTMKQKRAEAKLRKEMSEVGVDERLTEAFIKLSNLLDG